VIVGGQGKARQKATPTKSPRAISKQEANAENKKSTQSPLKKESSPFIKIKSQLFNSIYFYFDKEDNPKNINKYKILVTENSGKKIEMLPSLNSRDLDKEIFYLTRDSPDFIKKKDKCYQDNPKLKLQFISYRWVDHCIANKNFLRDVFKSRMIHLLPFSCHTPLLEFKDKVICVTGFDNNEEFILENILKILGSKIPNDK
jgi:hypothetical protein